jgi:hypothetical protein
LKTWSVLVAALCALGCREGGTSTAPAPAPAPRKAPDGGASMTRQDYPNVHVRLRLAGRAAVSFDSEVDIWLKGTRFRLRDSASRLLHEIIEDVTTPDGLGMSVHSFEELVDQSSAPEWRRGSPPTELYGDIATGKGWVYLPDRPRRPASAAELAPAAEQILSRGKTKGLEATGPATRLSRAATEYRGTLSATVDGQPYQTSVSRVVAGPFVLLEEVRSVDTPSMSHTRTILAIEEGSVSDADVTPPE